MLCAVGPLSDLLTLLQYTHPKSHGIFPIPPQGCYSWEADLWSIGVITYILLSGFPPFWGSSDYMIFQRILENEVVGPNFFFLQS